MVVCRTILFLFLFVAAAGVRDAVAQSHSFFTVNGRKINVDTFNAGVNRLMEEVGVPGVSLAIIENNRIIFNHAYGYKKLSTKEKVDTATIFDAGSLSKNFLAYVVYKLADEGVLDLDRPMYQYLEYEPLKHDPRYKRITSRMVLSHSSGIENWKYMNNPDTLEILSNPGEKFVYSGEGYDYLAKVVEVILHKPYTAYIADMVFAPLGLKRTYPVYSKDGAYPVNYATGHTFIQKESPQWKNDFPSPAAGMHMSARDYATLIVSIFDKRHLSDNRIRDILAPLAQLDKRCASIYYGPGFEVLFGANDTIVCHGGSTGGFKNLMYYSVVNKRGLVFLTNSDRGKAMAKSLCAMSVGLNIDPYFEIDYYSQYPSYALALLRIYVEKGPEAMFTELEALKRKLGPDIGENTLNELGDRFFWENGAMTRRLLQENLKLFPESAQAHFTLGELEMMQKNYKIAYEHLTKAKALHVNEDGVDGDISRCLKALGKVEGGQ